MKRILGAIIAKLIAGIAHFITAVRPIWRGTTPEPIQRVYCPNHSSNGDFVLVWTALPPQIRRLTRPVAASDYWLKTNLRAFVIRYAFRAILINRNAEERTENPVELMSQALHDGNSIIIFPEGGRNMTDEPLLPLKTGIFHLAEQAPETEFVPVWINNINRALPKGEVIPLPMLCSVSFGEPIILKDNESKSDFLQRMHDGIVKLHDEVKR